MYIHVKPEPKRWSNTQSKVIEAHALLLTALNMSVTCDSK